MSARQEAKRDIALVALVWFVILVLAFVLKACP